MGRCVWKRWKLGFVTDSGVFGKHCGVWLVHHALLADSRHHAMQHTLSSTVSCRINTKVARAAERQQQDKRSPTLGWGEEHTCLHLVLPCSGWHCG
jgi:hypothetical protein